MAVQINSDSQKGASDDHISIKSEESNVKGEYEEKKENEPDRKRHGRTLSRAKMDDLEKEIDFEGLSIEERIKVSLESASKFSQRLFENRIKIQEELKKVSNLLNLVLSDRWKESLYLNMRAWKSVDSHLQAHLFLFIYMMSMEANFSVWIKH